MKAKRIQRLCLAVVTTIAFTPTASESSNRANASGPAGTEPLMGYAEFSDTANSGFKALIFDNGTGYVFRQVAPNRIDTWRIKFSEKDLAQLHSTYLANSFSRMPSKIKSRTFNGTHRALWLASESNYHEVKNLGGKSAGFEAIRIKFSSLVEARTKTAPRVPITELLDASERYKASHPIDSPKVRLVRNITSDFCRSLAAQQNLDYKLARVHFLPNRYLLDVDTTQSTMNGSAKQN